MVELNKLSIQYTKSIKKTLRVINENARGICFVLNGEKLVGVATDGDIRRGLLKGINIENPITKVMNEKFISFSIDTSDSIVRNKFNRSLKLIPLCDTNGILVDVADAVKGHRIPILEPELNGNELEYVEDCIKTNWISSQGQYVNRFEKIFDEMHKDMNSVAVSNGTVALHLALVSLGIGTGDEVILPDLTFAATINAVIYTGATPVLCEVDSQSWCINVVEAEKLISSKTKVILPVHLYGHPCNMDSIVELAKNNKLFIIEDCAEAIGSKWNNKPVGVFGDSAMFSFFGNKTISTGEGGMVLFRDKNIAERAKLLRDHGMSREKKYWHDTIGYNYRMTNLQAAIGVAQMERFSAIIEKKRFIAKLYNKYLENIDEISQLPKEYGDCYHSYWLYTLLLKSEKDRNDIIKKLLLNGIDTRPVFYPLHQMPPYKNNLKSSSLKVANKISQSGISLPSSVRLKEQEIRYICETLIRLIKNKHD